MIKNFKMDADETIFWFGYNEVYDTKEKRNNLKPIEKINSMGMGTDNRNIERKLRRHKKELKWKEPERRGRKETDEYNKIKYKNFDLISGYEKGIQWRIRMKISSKGSINFWIGI